MRRRARRDLPLEGRPHGSGLRRSYSEPDRIAAGAQIPDAPNVPHMKNWFECMRTRKPPNATIDDGFGHAVACIMADEAFATGNRMTFDAARRVIRAG